MPYTSASFTRDGEKYDLPFSIEEMQDVMIIHNINWYRNQLEQKFPNEKWPREGIRLDMPNGARITVDECAAFRQLFLKKKMNRMRGELLNPDPIYDIELSWWDSDRVNEMVRLMELLDE